MIDEEYYRHYEEETLKIIRNAGKWLVYYDEKTSYFIDVHSSLNKLEKMVKNIK